MASRRGSGRPLALGGDNWHNPTVTALFVHECLLCATLIACLVLVAFFKWIRPTGASAGGRTGVYFLATLFTLLDFLVRLVDTGLREEETDVTHLYYIMYIFQSLFLHLGEFLTLAVIFRTVYVALVLGSPASNIRKMLRIAQIAMLTLLAFMTVTAFALTAAAIMYRIIHGSFSPFEENRSFETIRVMTVYQVLYFISAVLLLVYGSRLSRSNVMSSKATKLLLITTTALTVRAVFDLVNQTVAGYEDEYHGSIVDFDWATEFIYVYMTAAIFLSLALYACVRPAALPTQFSHVQPAASTGHAPPQMIQGQGRSVKQRHWYGYPTTDVRTVPT